jgi:hypothetical protein
MSEPKGDGTTSGNRGEIILLAHLLVIVVAIIYFTIR